MKYQLNLLDQLGMSIPLNNIHWALLSALEVLGDVIGSKNQKYCF